MVVDKDDPSVVLIDGFIRDAVPEDRGAPWKIRSLMYGAWVKPDFHTWGTDLSPAVSDVVSDHVECRGVGVNSDVGPRVDFCVV